MSSPMPADATNAVDATNSPDDTNKESNAVKNKKTAIDKASDMVTKLESQVKILRVTAKKLPRGDQRLLKEKEVEAKEKKISKKKEELSKLKAALDKLMMKEMMKKAKDLAAQEKDEVKSMSREAQRQLCYLRLRRQSELDGRSDKNESVWDVIAAEYKAKIEEGTLTASDDVTLGTLKTKYHKLEKSFAAYAQEYARKAQSGAPREDLDKITTGVTCCTDIFIEFKVHERPKIVAPFRIDNETAAAGGEANPFRNPSGRAASSTASRGARDKSDDDGDEDDAGSDAEAAQMADEASDADETVAKTPAFGSFSTSHPKLNIGGSSKDKYRPKIPKKTPEDAILTAINEWREQDRLEDERRAKRARKAEKDMFKMLKLVLKKGMPVDESDSGSGSDSD
jgi:hypothetical protein